MGILEGDYSEKLLFITELLMGDFVLYFSVLYNIRGQGILKGGRCL